MAMLYSIARTPVATKNLASEEKLPTISAVVLHTSPLGWGIDTLCLKNKLNG